MNQTRQTNRPTDPPAFRRMPFADNWTSSTYYALGNVEKCTNECGHGGITAVGVDEWRPLERLICLNTLFRSRRMPVARVWVPVYVRHRVNWELNKLDHVWMHPQRRIDNHHHSFRVFRVVFPSWTRVVRCVCVCMSDGDYWLDWLINLVWTHSRIEDIQMVMYNGPLAHIHIYELTGQRWRRQNYKMCHLWLLTHSSIPSMAKTISTFEAEKWLNILYEKLLNEIVVVESTH